MQKIVAAAIIVTAMISGCAHSRWIGQPPQSQAQASRNTPVVLKPPTHSEPAPKPTAASL